MIGTGLSCGSMLAVFSFPFPFKVHTTEDPHATGAYPCIPWYPMPSPEEGYFLLA